MWSSGPSCARMCQCFLRRYVSNCTQFIKLRKYFCLYIVSKHVTSSIIMITVNLSELNKETRRARSHTHTHAHKRTHKYTHAWTKSLLCSIYKESVIIQCLMFSRCSNIFLFISLSNRQMLHYCKEVMEPNPKTCFIYRLYKYLKLFIVKEAREVY